MPQQQQRRSIVMLYGIPRKPLTDSNYYNYFSWALAKMETGEAIYIGGGATDPSRPTLTEAETAVEILTGRLNVTNGRIVASKQGLDAREVLECLGKITSGSHIQIFCAESHQDLVRFLAWWIFRDRAIIVPLPFPANLAKKPARSMYLRAMRIPRTLLGIAGVYMSPARKLEQWFRARHMRKMATPCRDVS